MSIIYEPRGKAREYSPLAANLYDGCGHGCVYCYAPAIRFMPRQDYLTVKPRRDIIKELEKDCKKLAYCQKQVMLCFMGDPYCKENDEHKITGAALRLFYDYKIPVAVLSKGGKRCLQDVNIIKRFNEHIQIGASLVFKDEAKRKEYEPYAAPTQERMEVLKEFHGLGVKTWASFEPVIDPDETIEIIKDTLDYIDIYKVGKINNFKGLDKTIDWPDFLERVVSILREAKKPFYIKHDLRAAAQSIKLYGNEVLPDEFCVRPFEKEWF